MAWHVVSRSLVVVLISSFGHGCTPDPSPDAGPRLPALAFDGLPQTVSCTQDDAEPNTPGFQLAVEVVLSNDDDSGFTSVSVTNSREDIVAGEGAFEDGRATVVIDVVPDAEAPGAENTLTAGATSTGGDTITASETVRVICADTESPLASCLFTQPSNPALVASPAAIEVTCSGGDPENAEQQALLTAGVVVVTAVPLGDVPAESVELDLVGHVASGFLELPATAAATLELLLVDPTNAFGAPVIDSMDVTIDLGVHVETIVVLAAADGVFNIADNAGVETTDPLTSDVSVTFERDVSGGSFTGTTALGTCTPAGIVTGATITLVDCDLPQGIASVNVSGQDAAGAPVLASGATFAIVVDTIRPVVAFSLPAADAVLTSADDAGTTAAFEATFVLTSADEGAEVTLRDNASDPVVVTVTDGSAVASLPLGEGARTVTADVTDASGNEGARASIEVTVDSIGPALVLVAADVDAAADLDAVTEGIQVDVTVTPTGLTTGRTITIANDDDSVLGTCLSTGEAVAVSCRVTYVVGVVYAVTASASDELGNIGTSNTAQVSP